MKREAGENARRTIDLTLDGTVVIVDDDASVRKALARFLQSFGAKTRVCESAEEFLEQPRPDGPACLLLDVRLPGASGLELQERLQRSDASLPIVFITGHGDVPLTVRAMKLGAIDFLVKPFEDDELLRAIATGLELDEAWTARREQDREVLDLYARLTPRESQVFELVVAGLLNKQIGRRLGVTEKTVKVHRGQVMRKLAASSVPDLVRIFDVVRRNDEEEPKAPLPTRPGDAA